MEWSNKSAAHRTKGRLVFWQLARALLFWPAAGKIDDAVVRQLIDCVVDMFADLLRAMPPANSAVNDVLRQMTDQDMRDLMACAPEFFAGHSGQPAASP